MTLELSHRAHHFPDRTAVIDHTDDEIVTYGELDARADAAASRLEAAGVGSGDGVCVLARNRIEFLSLLWGTRRLDATLAPLSHRLTPETVGKLTGRIRPKLTLIDEPFTEFAPAIDGPTRPLDGIDRPTAGTPELAVSHEHPAMYLHTGGTTGTPKVVVITEEQLEWNAITEVAAWGLGKHEVIPLLLPMFHTGGWNLLTLPTLYVGGTVVIQRAFDPGDALAMIETYGATKLFGVAAIFQAMAAHDRFDATDFGTVDWCMSGGGPTPASLMQRYRDRGIPFTQGYGLTEGGPNNLYFEPDREDAATKSNTSVGRPFPDCEVRIVDRNGERCEPGEVGELEFRGPVTANRYLHTEDGTFEGSWVSTGDLASMDDAGDFYIEGRVDNMFISGGENVYPETIEAALEDHPAVAGAGVIPIDHEQWGQVPKAVIQPEAGQDVQLDELERHARATLPGFMVPQAFEIIDELPRSGPGKLDRTALAEYQ